MEKLSRAHIKGLLMHAHQFVSESSDSQLLGLCLHIEYEYTAVMFTKSLAIIVCMWWDGGRVMISAIEFGVKVKSARPLRMAPRYLTMQNTSTRTLIRSPMKQVHQLPPSPPLPSPPPPDKVANKEYIGTHPLPTGPPPLPRPLPQALPT